MRRFSRWADDQTPSPLGWLLVGIGVTMLASVALQWWAGMALIVF